jgi:hypothetical protein
MSVFFYSSVFLMAFLGGMPVCLGQAVQEKERDSSKTSRWQKITDTISNTIKQEVIQLKESVKGRSKAISKRLADVKRNFSDSGLQSKLPAFSFGDLFTLKPLLRFTGGFNTYNFNRRGIIDTPFAETNIYQHHAFGSMGVAIAGIPLRVNYLLRHSNSKFFNDIKDVQVAFDLNAWKANWNQ